MEPWRWAWPNVPTTAPVDVRRTAAACDAIARAIATRPIIMADEPTGALDSKTGKHVLEILRDLYREGPPSCCITTMTTSPPRRVVRLSDGVIISDAPEVDWT